MPTGDFFPTFFTVPGANKDTLKIKLVKNNVYKVSYLNPIDKKETSFEMKLDKKLKEVEIKDGVMYLTFEQPPIHYVTIR